MGAKNFMDLIVWRKASALSNQVDSLTAEFPKEELYRLAHQMKTAASSIPANIAEGFGRWSPRDQARFYEIAKTSAGEVKVHLRGAKDLGYSTDLIDILALADEVCAMLYTLRQRVLSRGSGR